jgi:mannose-6-phosphate isomerase-like protein (cupin superfamily)
MPPNTEENLHYHNYSQQFFYILKGTATFIIEGLETKISRNEGIHVPKGKTHRILNQTENDLEFLVISEPHSHGDKFNVSE